MSRLGGILVATALTLAAALSAFAQDDSGQMMDRKGGHMMSDGDHQKGMMGDDGMMGGEGMMSGGDHDQGMMSGKHHDQDMMGKGGMMGDGMMDGEGSQDDE